MAKKADRTERNIKETSGGDVEERKGKDGKTGRAYGFVCRRKNAGEDLWSSANFQNNLASHASPIWCIDDDGVHDTRRCTRAICRPCDLDRRYIPAFYRQISWHRRLTPTVVSSTWKSTRFCVELWSRDSICSAFRRQIRSFCFYGLFREVQGSIVAWPRDSRDF